jgi:DNA-binding LacI/PurR family transcriptional regulator
MPFSKNERISITQVAKEAQVSIQTVSRVINEQPGVSRETRIRVRKIIEDLGYYPSRAAKAMRGKSRTLGIVGFGLELYGPSRTLVGAQREASKHNYGVVLELVQDPEDLDLRTIFEVMFSNHVDGIVWCIPYIGSNAELVISKLAEVDIPVIFTDVSPSVHDLTVQSDNYLGGKLATQHLIDAGHRAVGLITGPMSYYSARERKRGWADALRDQNLPFDESWVVEGDWSAQSGAIGIAHLNERHPELTAVFASNDPMALGVLSGCARLGLAVPGNVAVVGYDDIPEADFFYPPLSSIRQNVVALGEAAVSQVIRAIDSLAIRGSYLPQQSLIKPELVVRASSALSGQLSTERNIHR